MFTVYTFTSIIGFSHRNYYKGARGQVTKPNIATCKTTYCASVMTSWPQLISKFLVADTYILFTRLPYTFLHPGILV